MDSFSSSLIVFFGCGVGGGFSKKAFKCVAQCGLPASVVESC
jgi:hypothetical protein